ncbi:GNAT family N-acetyltransferase [Musicola keenii]|uniref:GNAT family N-acetyltransferase n=1 Tax=Musicola keenii TaxID=2884250 RepID=UPI00177FBA55|nr:GNAT family N-acetyltransferase [Musicola keenii]
MHLELLPATESDINYLLHLRTLTMKRYLEDVGAPTDKETFLQRIRHEFAHANIIMVDSQRAGLFKYRFIAEQQHWYLLQIQVHPDYQHRGIGGMLISDVIARAAKHHHPVVLSVLKSNPARKLYERLGFRITSEGAQEFIMTRTPDDSAAAREHT